MSSREHKARIQSLLHHWKNLLAIGLVIIAVIMDLLFVWGIFFWFWAIENIRTGEAYFVESVKKDEEPILYWLIITILILVGIYYFFFDEHIYFLLIQALS